MYRAGKSQRKNQSRVDTFSSRKALNEYIAHFHRERNHHGKRNVLLFPEPINSGSAA
jgi:hypothetical protein